MKTWNARAAALVMAAGLSYGATAAAAPVTLTTGNDYAPFAHSQLPGGGLAPVVVQAALESRHLAPQLTWTSWSRAMEQAKAGQVAGTFPWFLTKEREADFLHSEPIYEIHEYAFTKGGAALDFSQLDSLQGRAICLPKGWAVPPAAAELLAAGKIRQVDARDASFCMRLLYSGRADFFITDPFQGRETMKKAGLDAGTIAMSDVVLATRTLHLLVARGQAGGAEVIQSFNDGLSELKKSGKYDEIVQQYTR